MRSRRINTHLFSDEAVYLRHVKIRAQRRFAKAVSRAFVRIDVRFVYRVYVLVGRLGLYVAMRGLLVRPITIDYLIVDVYGIASYGKFQAVVTACPINVKRISTSDYYEVRIANRGDHHSCLDERPFRFLLLRLSICQQVILGPLYVTTCRLYALNDFRVFGVRREFPTYLRTRQIAVAFNGAIRGIGT